MSDKYKVLRNAEKYVIAGRFAQAIREYQRLLVKEPDEPTLLNTIGDLLLKQENKDEALVYFGKVAEVYLRNGFLVKTIAVYKKIHQLNPADPAVNESLADLYQKQGLTFEAARHLQILVERHEGKGEYEQAAVYLQRLAELDPSEPKTQLHLASVLEQRSDKAGAFEHYQAAAALYLQRDAPDQAFAAAQKAVALDPTNDRMLEIYVRAAARSRQTEQAEILLAELAQKTGQRVPYLLFLAQLLEEKGDLAAAYRRYSELQDLAFVDSRIREGIARTAPAREQEGTIFQASVLDLMGQERPSAEKTPSSSVFGEWNEVEESPAPAPSVSAGRGLFEAQPAPPFADFDWKATVIQPEEEEEEEVYEEPELEGEETPLALVEEAPIGSLDEALQEADFYLKLGFREEAKKLLERLLHDYPRDDRVRRRAEKVMIIPPELLEVEPAPIEPQPEAVAVAEEAETGPGFDLEIDSALDTLFTGEGLDEEPGEVLRYDVAASTSADEAGSPKVHYDLGLAYKEMGLLEDAIQEFQSAVQMLDDPASNPQKILCCSMLANSYLQLGRFTDAIRCAEEGLLIPGQKEFEWKALKYELSSAYEKRGDYAQALAGFNDILERDPEYRDVRARLTQLQRLHGQ